LFLEDFKCRPVTGRKQEANMTTFNSEP
jgi:hypothetical protein